MEVSPKLRQQAFQKLRAAVEHQGKLWDIALDLAELRGLEQDQVMALVQEKSMMADTGRDLTEEDFEDFLALNSASQTDQRKGRSDGC